MGVTRNNFKIFFEKSEDFEWVGGVMIWLECFADLQSCVFEHDDFYMFFSS